MPKKTFALSLWPQSLASGVSDPESKFFWALVTGGQYFSHT